MQTPSNLLSARKCGEIDEENDIYSSLSGNLLENSVLSDIKKCDSDEGGLREGKSDFRDRKVSFSKEQIKERDKSLNDFENKSLNANEDSEKGKLDESKAFFGLDLGIG